MNSLIDKQDSLLTKLIKERKIKNKKKEKAQSWEEQREHIIAWTSYYRRNLDIFIEEYLEIKLKFFQRVMVYLFCNYDILFFIMSRGSGKTFITAVVSIAWALLCPNSEIMIASLTLNQSSLLIKEKIDKELCGDLALSPILQYLKEKGYIRFKYDKDAACIEIGNGSKIFSAVCGEGSRGLRSTVLIVDEARLVKKTDINSILRPTLRPRVYPARLKQEYKDFFEEPKQLYLSSARTKDNWLWNALRDCVNNHYNNKKIKYAFLSTDIFTSVASGIKTEAQMLADKQDMDALSYEMESLNLFLSDSEDSLFRFDDFHNQQNLSHAFYEKNPLSRIDDKYIYKYEDVSDETRMLIADLAISGGRDDDNSVFMLGTMDNFGNFTRKERYIETRRGMNAVNQVIQMKRLFYDFGCEYFIMDSKGLGNVIFDMLTVETYDEERDVTYPAWTICFDKDLQISSDKVINEKITRTIDKNAVGVIIPIAGTPEINSNMHTSLSKTLKMKNIQFLKDDAEMEVIFGEDPDWLLKSSEEKVKILLPFVETRFLINEAVSLEVKITRDGIKVKEEKRTDTKDRYMTLAMFNYFCDKLSTKFAKDNQNEEYNDSDWDFLSGDYSNFNNLNLW